MRRTLVDAVLLTVVAALSLIGGGLLGAKITHRVLHGDESDEPRPDRRIAVLKVPDDQAADVLGRLGKHAEDGYSHLARAVAFMQEAGVKFPADLIPDGDVVAAAAAVSDED